MAYLKTATNGKTYDVVYSPIPISFEAADRNATIALSIEKTLQTMGLFDILFKSKKIKDRNQDKRIKEVLKRTDNFIERTERKLEEMRRDDKRWSSKR